ALHYSSSVNALCFLFVLTNHMFFLLQVFKLKLLKCSSLLKTASAILSPTICIRFHLQYIQVLRHVRMYNQTIKEYILLLDYSFKFSGALGIIFFTKQDGINLFGL